MVKKLYARTNKRNFGVQIAAHERRRRLLRRMRERMDNTSSQAPGAAPTTVPSTDSVQDKVQPQNDSLPRTPPRQHHHISESKRNPFDVFEFDSLSTIADDPAVEVSFTFPISEPDLNFSRTSCQDCAHISCAVYSVCHMTVMTMKPIFPRMTLWTSPVFATAFTPIKLCE